MFTGTIFIAQPTVSTQFLFQENKDLQYFFNTLLLILNSRTINTDFTHLLTSTLSQENSLLFVKSRLLNSIFLLELLPLIWLKFYHKMEDTLQLLLLIIKLVSFSLTTNFSLTNLGLFLYFWFKIHKLFLKLELLSNLK